MPETRIRYALRKLRHLYEQMLDGSVKDTAQAARGLLGPAIEDLEAEEQAKAWDKDHEGDYG